MKKFTEGPWIVGDKISRETGKLWENIQQRDRRIKTEDGLSIADTYDTAFEDMNEANAALISAAPEMYKMTETLLAVIETLLPSVIKYDSSDPFELANIKAKVERVLKKARGE